MQKKEKIVQRTFAKLDVDHSGYIDADELVSCLIPAESSPSALPCMAPAQSIQC